MKLKFYAKDDLLVVVPGTSAMAGQIARYAGRQVNVEGTGKNEVVTFPASQEGVEVDSESAVGARYVKLTRRDGALWPADAETAAFCGVPFVKIEFSNGVWSAAAEAVKGKK